ncbi:MAG: hypothetical protein AAF740_06990, partial [Bacteroidota bacterium]
EIIAFLIAGGAFSMGGLIIGGIAWKWRDLYKSSISKISDADLLRIIADIGIFSASDLIHRTSLTSTEAYTRIQQLALRGGALRVIYDANSLTELYTLKEPLSKFLDEPVRELNDQDIIYIAQNNYNTISPAHLCLVGDMTMEEARHRLKALKSKGVLKQKRDANFQVIYYLNDELSTNTQTLSSKTNLNPKIQRIAQKESKPLRDAAVIAVAVELGGKVSAAQLCLKKDISIEEAQKLLDYLQEQGVFEIQVSPHGSLEYHLIDKDLV